MGEQGEANIEAAEAASALKGSIPAAPECQQTRAAEQLTFLTGFPLCTLLGSSISEHSVQMLACWLSP